MLYSLANLFILLFQKHFTHGSRALRVSGTTISAEYRILPMDSNTTQDNSRLTSSSKDFAAMISERDLLLQEDEEEEYLLPEAKEDHKTNGSSPGMKGSSSLSAAVFQQASVILLALYI